MAESQEEQWQSVPRKDRKLPDELIGYERQYPFDPDYSQFRRERSDYMHDYFRDQEEKRDRESPNGRTPMYEDSSPLERKPAGFDRESFDLQKVVRLSQSRLPH